MGAPRFLKKVLWENDSSNFGAQTIELNSDDYDYVIIYAYRNASGDKVRTVSIVIEKGKSAELVYSDYFGNAVRAWTRKAEVNNNAVAFTDGTINGSVTNTCLVPYKIVGCKY